MTSDETAIRQVLDDWTVATRESRHDDILRHHVADAIIFDVLPPLKYVSAAAYRASWDEWQPETTGEVVFELEDLTVTAGNNVAFAFGLLQCGGTLPDGRTFRDTVRATFCLQRDDDRQWQIVHQHISKPFSPG